MTSGRVNLCNGFFDAGAAAAGSPCSGAAFDVPLEIRKGFGALIPAGAAAAVAFSGTVVIKRLSGDAAEVNGIAAPVATAYVDALLADGARVVTAPQLLPIDVEPGAR